MITARVTRKIVINQTRITVVALYQTKLSYKISVVIFINLFVEISFIILNDLKFRKEFFPNLTHLCDMIELKSFFKSFV